MSYPLFHPERPGDLPLLLSEEDFAHEFPGEGTAVEFKQGITTKKVQEAAVAFSNADGGVLLVGVNPAGAVTGLSQPGEKSRNLHEALKSISNCGRYEIREISVGSKSVLAVSIERRHEGFAQTSEGVVRVRRGASNPALLGADLSRFVAERAFHSFESTPTKVSLADADPVRLGRLRQAYGWPDDDTSDRLREFGFVEAAKGSSKLTVAGALLLLGDPTVIKCRADIDVRRFGTESQEPDKTWKISGSVAEQIERATTDILAELGSTTAVLGAHRVDMPKLPPRALREAVANAVAHRSYQNAGSAIRVEIHPDRVRITSPGGLPEPVTIENIRYQQAARNAALLDALHRMGLAEDLGRGIDRIEDDMVADLLQPPEFEDDGSFFTVTLRLSGTVTPLERAWVRQLIDREKLDARSGPVVVQAARQGSIANTEVRILLGVDSVVARSILHRLVVEGVFEQRGERGGAQYVLAPTAGAPVRIRHSDEELDQIVLELARNLPVTNALVRDHTGLDRLDALDLLRRLVQSGRLTQEGTRRGTRYLLPPERR
ncbi:MAG: ATP-binding protein [Acidimicrobiales bacterium]